MKDSLGTDAIVYLVFGGWDYEGYDVLAVLATQEEASEVEKLARQEATAQYDFVKVQAWRIGEVKLLCRSPLNPAPKP